MDAKVRENLISCQVDVDTVLQRFMGNEKMVIKFLIKFLSDTNFKGIGEYLEKGDADEAFKCAHTLKGVCANLGLNGMLETLSPMVEKLRSGVTDGVPELYERMKENYEKVTAVIHQLEQ